MGLFDMLKDQVRNTVENTISNEAHKVMEEKGQEMSHALKNNVKDYLEEAKEKPTTTEDGKKSIDSLISMMDHSDKLAQASTLGEGNVEELQTAIKEDVHNLGQATHTNVELTDKNSINENKD